MTTEGLLSHLYKEREVLHITIDYLQLANVKLDAFHITYKTFTMTIDNTVYIYMLTTDNNKLKIQIHDDTCMVVSFNDVGEPVGPNTQYLTQRHRNVLKKMGPTFIKRVKAILY